MPEKGSECLKLDRGNDNLLIFCFKTYYNNEKVMHHQLMVDVRVVLATKLS